MYGKHFQSMYSGSMVGSGSPVFAIWGYVISNMRPDEVVGAQVELNPKLLAFIIGEPEGVIQKAIEKLCAPDSFSRSKDEEGKRLVRLGEYDYRVVNGAKYIEIRSEEERREANRIRKQKQRASGKPKRRPSAPTAAERVADNFIKNGDVQSALETQRLDEDMREAIRLENQVATANSDKTHERV